MPDTNNTQKTGHPNETGREFMQFWIFIAAINGLIAVAAGAVGTHVLATRIPPEQFQFFDMATDYQLWHALGLLGVGLMSPHIYRLRGKRILNLAGSAFLTGIILFCGALYYLALKGPSAVHWMAPIGGGCLIFGWLALSASAYFIETKRQ